VFVVTELLAGGELYNLIIERAEAENGVPFSEREAATVMKQVGPMISASCPHPRPDSSHACQVLTTVAMLHDEGVVHRDIKPENLLLASEDRDLGNVALIDFGLSRFFTPGQRLTTRVGTVYYTAPEVTAASLRQCVGSADGLTLGIAAAGVVRALRQQVRPLQLWRAPVRAALPLHTFRRRRRRRHSPKSDARLLR
jgi:serine/threonine protein kinase